LTKKVSVHLTESVVAKMVALRQHSNSNSNSITSLPTVSVACAEYTMWLSASPVGGHANWSCQRSPRVFNLIVFLLFMW